jgi:hypothetical protein
VILGCFIYFNITFCIFTDLDFNLTKLKDKCNKNRFLIGELFNMLLIEIIISISLKKIYIIKKKLMLN